MHLPVAIIPCRTTFFRPLILYTCSPMRCSTHTPTTLSMHNARLLVLMPHPTTPVICMNLKSRMRGRVAPNLAKTGSRSAHSPYSFTRSTSSWKVVPEPLQHFCVSRRQSQEVQRRLERQRGKRACLKNDRGTRSCKQKRSSWEGSGSRAACRGGQRLRNSGKVVTGLAQGQATGSPPR